MKSNSTTGFGRLVNACFATFIFLASSAMVSLLYTFVVKPNLTNERPPGTFEACLPAWFVLYELVMLTTMVYIWREERSLDPDHQREAISYFAFLTLPLIFWIADDSTPIVAIPLLSSILVLAFYEAQTIHQKATRLCQSGCTGISA